MQRLRSLESGDVALDRALLSEAVVVGERTVTGITAGTMLAATEIVIATVTVIGASAVAAATVTEIASEVVLVVAIATRSTNAPDDAIAVTGHRVDVEGVGLVIVIHHRRRQLAALLRLRLAIMGSV